MPTLTSDIVVYVNVCPDSGSNKFMYKSKQTFVSQFVPNLKKCPQGVLETSHSEELDEHEVTVSLTFPKISKILL